MLVPLTGAPPGGGMVCHSLMTHGVLQQQQVLKVQGLAQLDDPFEGNELFLANA